MNKVKSIFDGKPKSLTTDFNMFLPPEYHIKPEDQIHPENFSAALQLVKRIRERFVSTQPKVGDFSDAGNLLLNLTQIGAFGFHRNPREISKRPYHADGGTW